MNLREEQIISKLFTDIQWLTQFEHPLKISIGFLLKFSAQFVPVFYVINIQIQINWRNSPRSISGPLTILLVSIIMTSSTKVFGRNSTNAVR